MTPTPDGRRLSWDVVTGDAVRDVFDQNWDALARLNPKATAFQSAAWHRAWIEAVAAGEGKVPLVVTAGADGRTVAAMALQEDLTAPRPVLQPLTAPWADYHDAVGVPGDEAGWRTLLDGLAAVASSRGAELELGELVRGGLLDRALPGGIERGQASPVCGIELDAEGHLQALAGMKEYAVKHRRLARLAELSCRHYREPAEIESRLSHLVALHRAQWAGRPEAVAPFDDLVEGGFRAMVRRMAPAGHLVYTELSSGDNVIACYFGMLWERWYCGYRTAYDADYFRYSPGHLMLRAMIDDFPGLGITYLDLTRGAYAYKAAYANRADHNTRMRVRAADLVPQHH
ncbi:GNAT family N-acetyltransferase [Catellatospora sp. NPDC049609]|uniref:GNAT family N-acetyltransferase n=1 Tax=Catellatospora sp. NPDC049609 TaxID=3155505 RepID=UPI00342569A2